jgi:hypothetical protein
MESAYSTIDRSPVVAHRLVWGLMDSPKSVNEAAPLPAFQFRVEKELIDESELVRTCDSMPMTGIVQNR